MDNKVLISVKTTQYIDGQPEEIELITEGIYYRDDNKYIAEYDESEISGMEGTKTLLEINDDSVAILRNGTTTSNLVFKMGLNHVSLYNTPYGALEVTIKPKKVDINMDDRGGIVKLEYRMETMGIGQIENELELNIKEMN